jgi:hypothetical protein
MKGTFRKQLLQQLLNDEAEHSPRAARSSESKPIDQEAVKSLCSFVYANPSILKGLGKVFFLQENLANCIFATSTEQARISLLLYLVRGEISKKAVSEPGSILRGSGLTEVLLGRHVKQSGAPFVASVLKKVQEVKNSGSDAGSIVRHVHSAIVSSVNDLLPSIRVVLAAIRDECELRKLAWSPLIGGVIVLRLVVPALMANSEFGANTSIVVAMLQKIASGAKLFAEGLFVCFNFGLPLFYCFSTGEENSKFNGLLQSLSFDEFFRGISEPCAFEGSTEAPAKNEAALLQFAQIFFVYFPRIQLEEEATL